MYDWIFCCFCLFVFASAILFLLYWHCNNFELWKGNPSSFVLFTDVCLALWVFLLFHMNFILWKMRGVLIMIVLNLLTFFGRLVINSVNPWAFSVFPFYIIFLNLFGDLKNFHCRSLLPLGFSSRFFLGYCEWECTHNLFLFVIGV